MNLQNEEHYEARSKEIEDKKKKLISLLPEKYKNKFKIIDECCKKLKEAEVEYTFFPILPSLKSDTEYSEGGGAWVYTNSNIKAFDENGKPTKEYQENAIGIEAGTIMAIYDSYCSSRGLTDAESRSIEQTISFLEYVTLVLNFKNQI